MSIVVPLPNHLFVDLIRYVVKLEGFVLVSFTLLPFQHPAYFRPLFFPLIHHQQQQQQQQWLRSRWKRMTMRMTYFHHVEKKNEEEHKEEDEQQQPAAAAAIRVTTTVGSLNRAEFNTPPPAVTTVAEGVQVAIDDVRWLRAQPLLRDFYGSTPTNGPRP
jgi:hypothetical protein